MCCILGRLLPAGAAAPSHAVVAHVVAVSDSKGAIHDPKGLDPKALHAHKASGQSLKAK